LCVHVSLNLQHESLSLVGCSLPKNPYTSEL
jgi:hypothetical protein